MNSKNFLKDDRLPIAVSLLLLVVLYYLLNSDFSFFETTYTKGSNSGFAKVTQVKSDVRLRPLKNVFWSNAQLNDFIDQGDSLFVGENSSIKITFTDGKSITVGSNSFIKFKTENNKLKLNLQYGSIKSDSIPSELVLDDCGQTLNLKSKNSDLELSKSSECGKLKVKSKKGSLTVNNKAIKNEVLVNNKTLIDFKEITQNPFEKDNSDLPLSLSENQNNFTENIDLKAPILIKKQKKILLDNPNILKPVGSVKWLPVKEATSYKIEVSDNDQFTNALVFNQTSLNDPQFKIQYKDQEKVYYRVKALHSVVNPYQNQKVKQDLKFFESDFSETGELQFIFPKIKPKNSKIKINYFARNKNDLGQKKQIKIEWNSIPQVQKYIVYVQKSNENNSDFKNAKKIVTRSPAGIIEVDQAGEYKYKVEAFNSQSRKVSSMDSLGEIIYNRLFDLESPKIEETMERLFYYFQSSLGKFIWLKWSGQIKNNEKFRVEISKEADFKTIFKAYRTQKHKMLVQDKLEEGLYYWRVRAENLTNQSSLQVSDWSNLGIIKVQTK